VNLFATKMSDIQVAQSLGGLQNLMYGTPQPPTDFNVTKAGTAPDMAVFHVGDQSGPPERSATVAYRIYYTPILRSAATDLSNATTRQGIYKAGQFVTKVDSRGNAAKLTATDSNFQGKKGWFVCVGINRMNQESLPLNICPSPWN
jgi:hypothetical protein